MIDTKVAGLVVLGVTLGVACRPSRTLVSGRCCRAVPGQSCATAAGALRQHRRHRERLRARCCHRLQAATGGGSLVGGAALVVIALITVLGGALAPGCR